jgi:hypothetical protein
MRFLRSFLRLRPQSKTVIPGIPISGTSVVRLGMTTRSIPRGAISPTAPGHLSRVIALQSPRHRRSPAATRLSGSAGRHTRGPVLALGIGLSRSGRLAPRGLVTPIPNLVYSLQQLELIKRPLRGVSPRKAAVFSS